MRKRQLGNVWWKKRFNFSCIKLHPYLYLVSGRGLSLRGRGDTLRSESDSETGLRGRDAEEVGRLVGQLWAAGADRGLGRVDIPDRLLEKAQIRYYLRHFLNTVFDICCVSVFCTKLI